MDTLRSVMIFLHLITICVIGYLVKSYFDHYGFSRFLKGEDLIPYSIASTIIVTNSIFRIRLLIKHLKDKSKKAGIIGNIFRFLQVLLTCFLIYGLIMTKSSFGSSFFNYVALLIINGILSLVYTSNLRD